MPTLYNGDGTIPVSVKGWTRVPIASITATTPVQVITTGAHGFNNGDTVGIEGTSIYTALDGLWVITTLSTTGFSLNTSTAGAGGTTSGYALDYSVGPQFQLPSDGDLRNASTANAPLEGAANAIPYMYKRAGAYSLFGIYNPLVIVGPNPNIPVGWLTTVQPTDSLWHDVDGLSYLGIPAPYPVLQKGDVLVITFTCSEVTVSGGVVLPTALGIALSQNNGTLNAGTYLPGSAVALPPSYNEPLELTAIYVAQAADANKRFDVSLMIFGNLVSPCTVTFKGDRSITIQHYRTNV